MTFTLTTTEGNRGMKYRVVINMCLNNTISTQWEYWEDYCAELEKRAHIVPSHCSYIDWDRSQKVQIRIHGVDYYITDVLGEPELVRIDE